MATVPISMYLIETDTKDLDLLESAALSANGSGSTLRDDYGGTLFLCPN